MRNLKEVLCRVNIQEVRTFVLDGLDRESWGHKPDTDSYEERLQKAEIPFWEFLTSLYPEGKEQDAVYEMFCGAILANQEVYTELGMWLGANLILELLQLNPIKGQGHEEDNKEG